MLKLSRVGSKSMTRLLKEVDHDSGEEFDSFCHELFHQNCTEREAYNEPLFSFDEYVAKNRNFLLEAFKKRS